MITTEWRDKKTIPNDDKPECPYCNSQRFVITPKGELKPCPTCNRYYYLAWADEHPEEVFQGEAKHG